MEKVETSLRRFLTAQNISYAQALMEIKSGRKISHWIWWILPQMKGLGTSERSNFYGIKDRAEATAYINHPILGRRLVETIQAILDTNLYVSEIFGNDTIKVRACCFLFASVSDNPVFKLLIKKNNWH